MNKLKLCLICNGNDLCLIRDAVDEMIGRNGDVLCKKCGCKAGIDKWDTRIEVEKLEQRITHLETDRNNAINQMSKSWKHASDKESDILTRYVAMAENQFKVKHQRIADLERQLKAEREINDRLRVVETERAVRNDELYEVLDSLCSYLNEDGLTTSGLREELIKARTILRNVEGDYDDSH